MVCKTSEADGKQEAVLCEQERHRNPALTTGKQFKRLAPSRAKTTSKSFFGWRQLQTESVGQAERY
jgi:hypothetical protein